MASVPEGDVATPLSAQHQLQLLRERLEQQAQQTRAAVAQLLLLRDQLAAEQAARCEAQVSISTFLFFPYKGKHFLNVIWNAVWLR